MASRSSNSIVPALIALNVAIFLLWNLPSAVSARFMEANFAVSWNAVVEGRWWVLLTAVFSHFLLWHILLNMLVLLSFGPPVEAVLGTRRFLQFYLIAGLVSSLMHCAVSHWVLGQDEVPAVGASGAIVGVLLLFALMFPRQRIYIFGLIPIPALWGAAVLVGFDVWGLLQQSRGGESLIGHGAHLGGALAGWLGYLYFRRSAGRWSSRAESFI